MGVDNTLEAALAKALLAAGMTIPRNAGVLLSIADRDKPEARPLIASLSALGHSLYATEGTAALIEEMQARLEEAMEAAALAASAAHQ